MSLWPCTSKQTNFIDSTMLFDLTKLNVILDSIYEPNWSYDHVIFIFVYHFVCEHFFV
jgi:hypothetical protein